MTRKNGFMQRQRGFTLIEAMVSLVILSIGLLGVAALQLSSLRSNHSSSLRSQATLLAYDVVDRMRANQNAALAGNYDISLAGTSAGGTVALDDLVRWKQNLANTLPSGQGSVARTGTGAATRFTITVQWDDSRGAEAAMSFQMVTQI